jgi:hypothetical protein
MIKSLSVPLKWETARPKSTFPLLSLHEREQVAKNITFEVPIDSEHQRKCRWKSLRQLYFISTQSAYRHHSLEKALQSNPSPIITMEHFIMTVMHEFKFPTTLKMDAHLRWLYWAFDQDKGNAVDWRDIYCAYKMLTGFRWIRDKCLELFLNLADVFCEGSLDIGLVYKDDFMLLQPIAIVRRLCRMPCVLETELRTVDGLLNTFCALLESQGYDHLIKRRKLQLLLAGDAGKALLSAWADTVWERLSTDQQLTILDESQITCMQQAELIISKHRLSQALMMFARNTTRTVFREWRSVTIQETGARIYIWRKNARQLQRALLFWLKYARWRQVRRRRRALAEVMGAYAVKARCFLRIQLHNTNHRKVERIAGSLHPRARMHKLAGSHLRAFHRVRALRLFYLRWRDLCVEENHAEVALRHNRRRLLRLHFAPWRANARASAHEERQEAVVRENSLALERRLQETDEAFAALLQLEAKRDERIKRQQAEADEQNRQRGRAEYQARLKAERAAETRLLLSAQREERNKRIKQQMKRMKRRFRADWEERSEEMLLKARERVAVFVADPGNEGALEMRFKALKREFFALSSPETNEREQALRSYRNIIFLYIEARMADADGSGSPGTLEGIMRQFAAHSQDRLTLAEFTEYIRSLKTCLNDKQIRRAVRSIGASNDKEVSLSELQEGLRTVRTLSFLGAPGSPWRMYVDPAEGAICYHNLASGEKRSEYAMTDDLLRRIVVDNMYGEASLRVAEQVAEAKEEDWKYRLQEYMAKRLQLMFRVWKGRQVRKKRMWKVAKRLQREVTKKQRMLAVFLQRRWIGHKARKAFTKQLRLTIERVFDADSAQEFYYNHVTTQSCWEMPHLLRRYGQVTAPCAWVPMDSYAPRGDAPVQRLLGDENIFDGYALVPLDTALRQPKQGQEQEALAPPGAPAGAVEYWHVTARRLLPFKPDGFPICDSCNYLLAVHCCIQCSGSPQEGGRVMGGNFCFPCHRHRHAHPLGFAQCSKASKVQYSSTG